MTIDQDKVRGLFQDIFRGGGGGAQEPPKRGTLTCDITEPENLRLSSHPNATPMFLDANQTMVAGWVIHKPRWNGKTFFVLGCHGGVAHMLGYVVDVNHIPAVLSDFLQRMRGNVHEWENDGV